MATPSNIPTEPLSIDDVLPLIGEFGKFQILLETAFCIMIFPGSMLILIPYFAQHNPPWMCVANSTVCHLNGTYDTQSKFYKERCKMPRSEWQFTKPKEYSIMTQFDLYCDTEVYSYLATSLVFVSGAIGAIVLGWTSDRYGRRLTLLPSMANVVVLGFITSFSPTLWFYILTRTLIGFFVPGVNLQMFVLISEFVGPKWRPFAGITLWFSFALSVVVLGIIAIFVQTWKILMIVTTAPFFVAFLFFKFIPESTRWLHVNGRTDEAVAIFRKIAKVNGKELPDINLKPVPMDCSPGLTHYLHLFKPKKIAFKSLIQGYASMVNCLVSFGVSFGADDFSGNKYRDFIVANLVDLPATILAIYCCNKIGRKKTVLIPMFISGISCIAVSVIPAKTGGKKSDLIGLRVFFGVLGKFCITLSYNSLYTWSAELYPTVIRGAGIGFLQIACQIGYAMAPWVAKWLMVFHVVLPFSIMGGSAVICTILLLWLPETADKKTLESFGDQFKENDNVKASES